MPVYKMGKAVRKLPITAKGHARCREINMFVVEKVGRLAGKALWMSSIVCVHTGYVFASGSNQPRIERSHYAPMRCIDGVQPVTQQLA